MMEQKLKELSDAADALQTGVTAETQTAGRFVSGCADKMWPRGEGQALQDL